MNNSTVNFTTSEISTNSTTESVLFTDIVTMFTFSIFFILGFPTHVYIICLIVTRTNGVTSEFFNLNLSVCEIGNCLNCLFFLASIFFSRMAILSLFLLGFILTGRPLFQSLMCVERYLAVVHPVIFLKYKPLRYRVICCAVVWMLTLANCLFCLFMGQKQSQFLSMQVLLTLSIQLFCLVAVLRALKQSGPGERKREENQIKRKAFYIILITMVSTTIIYVPFSITGLVAIVTDRNVYAVWITGLICYVLGSFVQPILYLHRTGKLSFLRTSSTCLV